MREYAKLGPTLWTGTTGKALRKQGPQALLVAVYLVSAPGSNMLGVFYQPRLFIAHETGLGIEGASKGLSDCIDAGFCSYDEETEIVFVHQMAAWQIAEQLKPDDKRCKGIQRDYENLPENPFLAAFFHRYSAAFHLTRNRGPSPPPNDDGGPLPQAGPPSPIKAPSKPHRSQEQEQEHKTEDYTQSAAPVDNSGHDPGVCVDNFDPAPIEPGTTAADPPFGLDPPGPYGAAWGLLHRRGVVGASPGDAVLRALVDKGVSLDEWQAAVDIAAARNRNDMAYVVGIVEKRRVDAAHIATNLPAKAAPAASTALVVPPTETAAQYVARMAAERAAAQRTPDEIERARAANRAALERVGRKRHTDKRPEARTCN